MLYIPGYALRKVPIINLEAQIIALRGGKYSKYWGKYAFSEYSAVQRFLLPKKWRIQYGHKKLINLIRRPMMPAYFNRILLNKKIRWEARNMLKKEKWVAGNEAASEGSLSFWPGESASHSKEKWREEEERTRTKARRENGWWKRRH